MDLSLSDEQKQLQDAAERFVRDKYAFENRRKIAATVLLPDAIPPVRPNNFTAH